MTDLTIVRVAGAALGFNWLPVLVADELGVLARHGIALHYLKCGSVEKATATVRDGTADLAITPPEGAIADHLAGRDLRIVAANSARVPMSLVARPGITTIADLWGKTIGTSSLTEGTAIYTRLLLEQEGLSYPRDYEFALAGVHTSRWSALQRGEIDAAPQPAPWNFLAAQEGFELLAEVSDVLPELLFAAVISRASWLDENRETVHRVLAALAEGHELVNDPANDADVLPVYQRITTPEHPDLAALGLRYTRDLGMWPSGLLVPPDALKATIEVMIRVGLVASEQRTQALDVLHSI